MPQKKPFKQIPGVYDRLGNIRLTSETEAHLLVFPEKHVPDFDILGDTSPSVAHEIEVGGYALDIGPRGPRRPKFIGEDDPDPSDEDEDEDSTEHDAEKTADTPSAEEKIAPDTWEALRKFGCRIGIDDEVPAKKPHDKTDVCHCGVCTFENDIKALKAKPQNNHKLPCDTIPSCCDQHLSSPDD